MVMLQIRNVAPEVHRELKVRAAQAGQSLSEFALAQLVRGVEKPARAEVLARLRSLPAADPAAVQVVAAIHADRVEREQAVDEAARR
ncbi:MAG: FitA-like ribbon-helix-helix domain-containing protein [Acidimicrobiales bacterium]